MGSPEFLSWGGCRYESTAESTDAASVVDGNFVEIECSLASEADFSYVLLYYFLYILQQVIETQANWLTFMHL